MVFKKIMSSLICVILVLGFGILTIRLVMINTMLDENWTNKIQNQLHYFTRISYRLNNEVKQVLVDNDLPNYVKNSFSSEYELKKLINARLKKLIAIKGGESIDLTPNLTTYYIDKFNTLTTDYVNKHYKVMDDTLLKQFELMSDEVTLKLDEFFISLESDNHLNSKISILKQFFNFTIHETVIKITYLVIFISLGLLAFIWQKNIYTIILYVSLSIVILGIILMLTFFTLHTIGFIFDDTLIITIRTELINACMQAIFGALHLTGSFLFVLGILLFTVNIALKESLLIKYYGSSQPVVGDIEL